MPHQGYGKQENTLTGLFGGMGGCAMVGQSIINIKSGGRGRLSGIVAAVALLLFILYLSEYIEMIPIAVLICCLTKILLADSQAKDKADRITPTITANARLSVNTVMTATEILWWHGWLCNGGSKYY
jgi:MFS superfamily sulfate permease-like transporter